MTKEELLQDTELFLIDLDGTVYLDDEPIFGVRETLEKLRARNKKLVFLTNNSSKTPEEYEKKLLKMGLFVPESDAVFTSAMATISLLKRSFRGKKVHLLATDAVKRQFEEEGVTLSEENPDVCVLAYDTTLTFEKMKKFNENLVKGAYFIATHPDDVCPTKDIPMPDVGSFLALFARSSSRVPDCICGKPHAMLAECVASTFGVKSAHTCMVGDRAYTDIRFANANGMKSILVLSGETKRGGWGEDVPDLVLEDFNGIFG